MATLRPMLEHYQKLGIRSFLINAHLSQEGDPVLDEIRAVTRDLGVPIAAVVIGNWLEVLRRTYRESRQAYPKDWHILADQDELQVYPVPLLELESICDKKGFHYVYGCWVDRIAADGRFPEIDPRLPLWDQFPVGAFLSYPIGAADPRKVVLARSDVDVCVGQHLAWNGRGCPISEVLVQVHHFKWTGGIIAELESRAELLKQRGYRFHVESARFAKYFKENNGRAPLRDPRILAAICSQNYPHWELVRKWLILINAYVNFGKQIIPGPYSLSSNSSEIARLRNKLVPNISSDRFYEGDENNDPTFGLEPLRQIWINSRH